LASFLVLPTAFDGHRCDMSHDSHEVPPTGALETDAEDLRTLLDTATEAVVEHLRNLPQQPVAPDGNLDPNEIRRWLREGYGFESPRPGAEVVRDVVAALGRWGVHPTHPGYFGLFNPTPTAAGIAGELVAAGVNPQLAAWSHAPAAVEVERHLVAFLASQLGMPSDSSGTFTTGGAEANLTGVLLALVRAFPAYREHGLRSLEGQPVFYASAESHLAWVKIAQMVGLGREALRLIPVGPGLEMDVDLLRAAIARDRKAGMLPFLVAATAGTTGAGAIDPLTSLADVAGEERLWLHTDAAWAGAVVLSDRLRPLLAGIERSDSVTVDAHKWLSVPMVAGMLMTRHPALLPEAFALSTSYMPGAVEDAVEPYTTSVQWSRRFAGLKLLLSLAVHGRSGYAAQLERDVRLGELLADRLEGTGWRRVNRTPLPVVCVEDPDASGLGDLEAWRWHADLADRVVETGRCWISPVRLAGRPAVRACVTSHRTGTDDLGRLVDAMGNARAAMVSR
jgi:aromatic-L-amino-acid/L-tryptophan decarboxylase